MADECDTSFYANTSLFIFLFFYFFSNFDLVISGYISLEIMCKRLLAILFESSSVYG